ncbi:NADPH-dependent 1-acyldihydroxyacetone phosphate reductase [Colletotrichum liriopes]|uniref:NADPH-dependent 1-acyldihydroxyacetone phosphate reductase n=1 Tax=Colletotrichum liriopes TaxID=708192 RepID=A0AA37LXM4_9PEZI|nr:NADPH-dependent 1-acyldihydroxyacetone phosphate reductase [Colletotrichum liriopes]
MEKYCASKGAIVSYSRTLRQELRPFGVRVMVAMAGTVNSNVAEKPQPSLAPDSLYSKMGDLYTRYVYQSQEEGARDTDLIAKELVITLRASFSGDRTGYGAVVCREKCGGH